MKKHVKLFEEWSDNNDGYYLDAYTTIDNVNRFLKNYIQKLTRPDEEYEEMVNLIQDDLLRKSLINIPEVVLQKAIQLERATSTFLKNYENATPESVERVSNALLKGKKLIDGLMNDLEKVLDDYASGGVNEGFVKDSVNLVKNIIKGFRYTIRRLDDISNEVNSIIKEVESGKR